MYQTTISNKFEFSGVGLHSGTNMLVTVHPAPTGTGVQFRRVDVLNCPYVKITPFNVTSTQLATTIQCGDFPISTIEHLMSGLYGLGVDNAYVDVHGAEIPILDGSALPIVLCIQSAGIEIQDKPKKYLKILREVKFELDDKYVISGEAENFDITFEIDFPHNAIGHQIKTITLTDDTYCDIIANARTFGFKKDVEMLQQMGLAKGGSVENAIVLDDESDDILNPGGLRNKDEFINHKILDLVGDFSLSGYRLIGSIYAKKSGHQLNNMFIRKLLESPNAYEIVEKVPLLLP